MRRCENLNFCPLTLSHLTTFYVTRQKIEFTLSVSKIFMQPELAYLENISRNALAKAAFRKNIPLFTSKLDLNLRKKLVKCYIWSMALYGVETLTLRKVDHTYLESFETWRWRIMEKISWTDRVTNDKVFFRNEGKRNIQNTIEIKCQRIHKTRQNKKRSHKKRTRDPWNTRR